MAYTNIDNEIIKAELRPTTKIVLIALISYDNSNYGYAFPSHKRLMSDTCIKNKTTIIKAIAELEEKGFISKEKIKGENNHYYIL